MMARRTRVLLLVDRLDERMGGGERTALTLATGLPRDRYEVWACATRLASGWPLAALEESGAHLLALGRDGAVHMAPFARLVRTLRRERIDVVHAHMFGSNVWGTLLGRLTGVPVVIAHEHSWSFEGRPVRRALDAVVGRAADAIVAVSKADAELMQRVERIPASRIRIIPSAWTPRPAATAGDLREEFGIPADAPVIGTVAVVRRVKRLELLVEAFAKLLPDAPDAWLVIGGGGSDLVNVQAAIEAHGVSERVVVTGLRREVESIWRAIDVAAMTSDREGTPVAALEAMGHGVPMVAPAVGGIPDLFEGGGGVLVPRHDTDALARELLALVRDPERRARIGAKGRERSAHFTTERQIERCAALYEELLATPAAGRRRARADGR